MCPRGRLRLRWEQDIRKELHRRREDYDDEEEEELWKDGQFGALLLDHCHMKILHAAV
jgi:hypothetical protein